MMGASAAGLSRRAVYGGDDAKLATTILRKQMNLRDEKRTEVESRECKSQAASW